MARSAKPAGLHLSADRGAWDRFPLPQEREASRPPVLLWIDDFEPGLVMYKTMFENLGFRVLTASSGKAGIRLMDSNPVDVVVTDYEMPEMDGEAVALAVKALNPQVPVVLFSGSTLLSRRARHAADVCCDKAAPRQRLLDAIHRLLHKKHALHLQPSPITQASDDRHRTVA